MPKREGKSEKNIYRPRYRGADGEPRESKIWWISYSKRGKRYRESSGSETKAVAKRLLKRREGELAAGKAPGILFEKTTFGELRELYLRDYREQKRKSLRRAQNAANHILEYFGENGKVVALTTVEIDRYKDFRTQWSCDGCRKTFGKVNPGVCPECGGKEMQKPVAEATCNRELSALKRMLSLGREQSPPLVGQPPKIRLLGEDNVRTGFFEHHEFLALRHALPEYLRPFVTVAYITGLRRGEIASLEWSQVDWSAGIITIERAKTKNGRGRIIAMDDELRKALEQAQGRRKELGTAMPWVFLNHRGDGPVKQFRKKWAKACETAGIGNRLFHDFRRTAVRNMVRGGVPENIAMKISGHRTRSIFDRYDVTSEDDIRQAAKAMAEYRAMKAEEAAQNGDCQSFVKVAHLAEKQKERENAEGYK